MTVNIVSFGASVSAALAFGESGTQFTVILSGVSRKANVVEESD